MLRAAGSLERAIHTFQDSNCYRVMTILNTDNTVPPITAVHFSQRGKAARRHRRRVCRLENRLEPHA